MLHTLYGEARSPLKGEVTQRGPAILVNLFYKKPPALQRHLFAVQVTVRSSRFRILPRGSGVGKSPITRSHFFSSRS